MDHITHLLRCEYWAKVVSKCNNRGMRKIDSEKGAEASAAIYSIVETVKANQIRIFEYIEYLLEELPKYVHHGLEIPEELVPWSKTIPNTMKHIADFLLGTDYLAVTRNIHFL